MIENKKDRECHRYINELDEIIKEISNNFWMILLFFVIKLFFVSNQIKIVCWIATKIKLIENKLTNFPKLCYNLKKWVFSLT
jgi:hypothetical protein